MIPYKPSNLKPVKYERTLRPIPATVKAPKSKSMMFAANSSQISARDDTPDFALNLKPCRKVTFGSVCKQSVSITHASPGKSKFD